MSYIHHSKPDQTNGPAPYEVGLHTYIICYTFATLCLHFSLHFYYTFYYTFGILLIQFDITLIRVI